MSDALKILEERFAKGEIDEAEFNKKRAVLGASPSSAVAAAANTPNFTGSVSSGLGWCLFALAFFFFSNIVRGPVGTFLVVLGVLSIIIAIAMFVLPKEKRA